MNPQKLLNKAKADIKGALGLCITLNILFNYIISRERQIGRDA